MARGDHLFVQCSGYSHHGIDCGNGRVIHFDSDPWRKLSGLIPRGQAPRICEVGWDEFVQGRPLYIRQYDHADDVELVVRRARQRLGERGYELFGNNCEHFAVWCKTGIADSTQVTAFVDAAARPLVRGLAAVPLIMRASHYLPGRLKMVAYGAAVAVTAGSFTRRYLENRLQNLRRGES